MGAVFLPLAFASLVAGILLKETALLVFGMLFLAILVYCLGACLAMAAAYRRRADDMGADFAPCAVAAGEEITALFIGTAKRFWTPPAILARYLIKLKTLDGRIIEKVFPRNFFTEKSAVFAGEKRGAYFGEYDYFLLCDIFGFFKVPVKIKSRRGERLLVYPVVSRETPVDIKNTGGGERTVKNARVSSDDLIEQRQYVPGDDPRRINWKLYGHSEELFVREGEKWGEPLSEIIIVIDTGTAGSGKKGFQGTAGKRAATDNLCKRALEIAVAATHTASSVAVYYRGGGEIGRRWTQEMDKRKLYALFALPYAVTGKAAQQVLPGGDARDGFPAGLSANGKTAVIVIKDCD
ncbi:MAG: DUF58 domain-containing protein [Spirochaetales bacterium]|jgi:hypothetical protein|nr:DUF58 domain-containing protein [Spirochaetales bacterium]